MEVIETKFENVKIIVPKRFSDNRGFFEEIYNAERFAVNGIKSLFVQDNRSYSRESGTVRGLHFQTPPFDQDKLVWCTRGALFDVAVDIRLSSPTFGQYITAELTPENGRQLFVPSGFAHGFCTLVPDTEIAYKVSNYYAPDHDAGVAWNDPEIAIDWPVENGKAHLSDKDQVLPLLSDAAALF